MSENPAAVFVGVDLEAVTDGVGGPETKDSLGGETLLGDDLREKFLGIAKEFRCLGSDHAVGEDLGELSVKFPRAKERGPVDIRDNFL